MKDRHLRSPLLFPWFRGGPPTFLILESPLILLHKFSGVRETLMLISMNVFAY